MITQTELYQKFEILSRALDYELLLNAINAISSVRNYVYQQAVPKTCLVATFIL